MTFPPERARPAPMPRRAGAPGFSMSELIIVISILGVLATISVGSFNQFLDSSKETLARERVESLNQAAHRYAQMNSELLIPRNNGAVTDELQVLMRLQYRNPDEDLASVGAPYYDPRYNPVGSSAGSAYRLRWTGRLFELLEPDEAGTGFLMDFDGGDFGEPRVFPPDFDSGGR